MTQKNVRVWLARISTAAQKPLSLTSVSFGIRSNSMAMRFSPGHARRILTQGPRDGYESRGADALAGRSFANFSAQAARVDSFLQNVKRTWRAPCVGSS